MPLINDEVYDGGLDYAVTFGIRLFLTFTQEATTWTEATATFDCGTKTLTTGNPEDGATDGRRVIVPAITDGSVTDTQTAGWWALTDATSVIVAANALSATQAVTSGNTFSLDAISITIRDATSV